MCLSPMHLTIMKVQMFDDISCSKIFRESEKPSQKFDCMQHDKKYVCRRIRAVLIFSLNCKTSSDHKFSIRMLT